MKLSKRIAKRRKLHIHCKIYKNSEYRPGQRIYFDNPKPMIKVEIVNDNILTNILSTFFN